MHPRWPTRYRHRQNPRRAAHRTLLALSRSTNQMADLQQPAVAGATTERALSRWVRARIKIPGAIVTRELLILFAVSCFTLLYGLIPVFGGDQLGLVGADE